MTSLLLYCIYIEAISQIRIISFADRDATTCFIKKTVFLSIMEKTGKPEDLFLVHPVSDEKAKKCSNGALEVENTAAQIWLRVRNCHIFRQRNEYQMDAKQFLLKLENDKKTTKNCITIKFSPSLIIDLFISQVIKQSKRRFSAETYESFSSRYYNYIGPHFQEQPFYTSPRELYKLSKHIIKDFRKTLVDSAIDIMAYMETSASDFDEAVVSFLKNLLMRFTKKPPYQLMSSFVTIVDNRLRNVLVDQTKAYSDNSTSEGETNENSPVNRVETSLTNVRTTEVKENSLPASQVIQANPELLQVKSSPNIRFEHVSELTPVETVELSLDALLAKYKVPEATNPAILKSTPNIRFEHVSELTPVENIASQPPLDIMVSQVTEPVASEVVAENVPGVMNEFIKLSVGEVLDQFIVQAVDSSFVRYSSEDFKSICEDIFEKIWPKLNGLTFYVTAEEIKKHSKSVCKDFCKKNGNIEERGFATLMFLNDPAVTNTIIRFLTKRLMKYTKKPSKLSRLLSFVKNLLSKASKR